MIFVYVLSSAESRINLYSALLELSIARLVVASFNDISPIEETGSEAGAVKYQICFPSKFDFLNISTTFGVPSNGAFSNPTGGLYGGGLLKVTTPVLGGFVEFL
jgi:hypothetical protein